MPDLAELRARYSRTETEVDSYGRAITVGLLKPDQRYRVLEMTDSQSPYVLMPFLQAAAVRKIVDGEGKELIFAAPRSRTDVDVVLSALDDEGMLAASKAMARLNPTKPDGAPEVAGGEAGN